MAITRAIQQIEQLRELVASPPLYERAESKDGSVVFFSLRFKQGAAADLAWSMLQSYTDLGKAIREGIKAAAEKRIVELAAEARRELAAALPPVDRGSLRLAEDGKERT